MRILGIDYGDVRVGLAVCDMGETLASGIGTVTISGMRDAVKKITAVCDERQIEAIVLGLPLNMDGSEGASASKIRAFADMLNLAMPQMPIELYDERRTSILAADYMSETGTYGAKRKKSVDTLSAEIILQSRLDREKNRKAREGS